MEPITTRTRGGRRITYTATPDEFGRVVYAVAGVGAFTLQVHPYRRDADGGWRVHVDYGRVEGPHRYVRAEDLPDRPVVCRVQLEGAAVFAVDTMRADHTSWWLACRRAGGGTAPDGTRNRTADIVRTLVSDWVARDDWEQLRGFQEWHLAPGRKAEYAREITRLNAEVAGLLQKLAANHHGYAEQAAILGETAPGPASMFPDPARREGQAILQLRAQLQALRDEHRHLAGADVVNIVQEWLGGMNLGLRGY